MPQKIIELLGADKDGSFNNIWWIIP
jgi:hypothetical protein